jgi:hypothetical protein
MQHSLLCSVRLLILVRFSVKQLLWGQARVSQRQSWEGESMNRREVREILAAHADGLDHPDLHSGRNGQVQGLLDLAEQLQAVLVPVAPDSHYRRRLAGELILRAQDNQEGSEVSTLQQRRRGILIGAAALGSLASVLGVAIAFVLAWRHGRAGHIATG